MNHIHMNLILAAVPVRDKIPPDCSLKDRLLFAMRYVREHERDLFWMVGNADDDMKLKTALAAVYQAGDENDQDIIARSVKPLKLLSLAAEGIPIDFSGIELSDDLLPLVGLWHESAEPPQEAQEQTT
jgi:hypothetical protein